MSKDDLVFVGHMLDVACAIAAKVRGIGREAFDGDENLRLALTHLIQTLGEAARKVSPEYRSAHPHIPWSAIVGMRHKVVHDYLHVDFDLVWDVATLDIQPLIDQIKGLVAGK